jgi:uncharacterized membrane protein required for colicin V production
MPQELQTADYILCGLTIVAAVTGLFRGFSGTLAFFLAAGAAAAGGSFGWAYSATLTDSLWQRGAGVLVATLLVFGLVRLVVKKLVNGILAQPSDAILGALLGALLGATVIIVWACSGLYTEYSALVRTVAAYVG